LYASARFSAFITASLSKSKENYQQSTEAAIEFYTEEFTMIPLSLKTIEPTAIAAAYSAATSLPGLLAVILKAGLIFVNLTSINQAPVYSEHKGWSKGGLI
jgi:hypothetical protein